MSSTERSEELARSDGMVDPITKYYFANSAVWTQEEVDHRIEYYSSGPLPRPEIVAKLEADRATRIIKDKAAASSTETTLDSIAQTKLLLHSLESYFTYL